MAVSPLQKSPIALLQAYNLQTLGQAPTGFGDTVVPTQDVEAWYLRDRVTARSASGTILAGGTSVLASAIVPAQEVWYLYALYGFHRAPAADLGMESVVQTRVFVSNGNSVVLETGMYLPGVNWFTATAADRTVSSWLPKPFILRGGDSIQLAVGIEAAATAGHTVGATALIALLS